MGLTAAQQAALYYARKRRRLAAIFSPASLFAASEQGGWYDPSDLSTMFTDDGVTNVTADGDAVYRINDKSGRGNHLTQATLASRPLYKTSGGLHWLEGDGVDDWLRATFTIAQPWERVSAIRQVTWTLNDQILGGAGANTGILQQSGVSANLRIYSGVGLAATGAALGQNQISTERHNGASSRAAINNGTYATGDAGSTATSGVTLFASWNGAEAANARCYGFIMREGTMTDTQIVQARTYLAAKAGVTL